MKSHEEMMTKEAIELKVEKLSLIDICDFTDDVRIIKIYRRYQKETGWTVEDFIDLPERTSLPEWTPTIAARFDAAIVRILERIDAHLTLPEPEELNPSLPPLNNDLATRLRKVGIDAISSIVRLNNCYKKSQALSLYAFAYKTDRMAVRNWGITSELQFVDALRKYLSEGPANETVAEEPPPAAGLDQEISRFLNLNDDELRHFYTRNFEQIQDSIRSQGRDQMLVSQIASEMDVKWPYRYRTRILNEFPYQDKTQLFKTPKLGIKKIRSILLCLIWASKGSVRNMDKFAGMTPHQMLEASPLGEDEKQALTLRFLGEVSVTIEMAAQAMGVTRERIRQHQKTTEEKIRLLGIHRYAQLWVRSHALEIWTMVSDDGGYTTELKGFISKQAAAKANILTQLATDENYVAIAVDQNGIQHILGAVDHPIKAKAEPVTTPKNGYNITLTWEGHADIPYVYSGTIADVLHP
jgi:hypothetical protein